ncbi:Protein phosphatase [Mycoplasmopsis bovigenitalium 51080]|uniref:Protein phosphatase n=1 Tax=Mycoplasmopsis bovigenitalium 51080 TaxID=1188235 RepID=N9V0Y5_9BACT|nr:PP2C family serine/threonine-protein phosphatase [Mycoplasmopsis bovigenitalium]ENY69067.1 Protein phosphatase [Mycoplasmopsis bovigenitalium 51080]
MNNLAELSVVGNVRMENEDRAAALNKNTTSMLIICDGMGGHFGGSYASSITVNTLKNAFNSQIPLKNDSIEEYANWFKQNIDKARAEMKKLGEHDEAQLDMGTTVAAAIFDTEKKFFYVFNIGDSRTYILTVNGDLVQISIDHNLLNRLIREEGMPEAKAKKIKHNTALTSALGPQKKTKIEVFDISNDIDKIYSVLCTSDGVHGFVDKPSIELMLKREQNAQKTAEELVKLALENRSTDNASVAYSIINSPKWSK